MRYRRLARVRKSKLRRVAEVSMQVVGPTLLVLGIAALLAGKISHDYEQEYGPKIRAAENYEQVLRRCERWGSKCKMYACYRTDQGKFICQEQG